jgi:hypothetical protein
MPSLMTCVSPARLAEVEGLAVAKEQWVEYDPLLIDHGRAPHYALHRVTVRIVGS